MRSKQLLRVIKITFIALLVLFVFLILIGGYIIPKLRYYCAQQLSADDFNRIVAEAYPSFDPSHYHPVDIMYFEDTGNVALTYMNSGESYEILLFDDYHDTRWPLSFMYDALFKELHQIVEYHHPAFFQ